MLAEAFTGVAASCLFEYGPTAALLNRSPAGEGFAGRLLVDGAKKTHTWGSYTAASHRLISSRVQVSGSPVGSCWGGNISPPHIAHTATPVTSPVKASVKKGNC